MMIPWHFFQCYIEVDILALYQNTPTIIGWIASTFMVSRRWTVITLLHWCFLSLYSPVVTINCWPLTSLKTTMHFKPANSEPCCGRVQPHRAFHFITSCSLSAVWLLQTIWWVDYYKLMLCGQKLFKPRAWLLILDWRPKFPRIPNMFVWITGEGPHNDAGDV